MSTPFYYDRVLGRFCRRDSVGAAYSAFGPMLSHHQGHLPMAIGRMHPYGYYGAPRDSVSGNPGGYLGPNEPDDVWDKLYQRIYGSKVDPNFLWKFPAAPPPTAAFGTSDIGVARWLGFSEGMAYGAGRASVTVGLATLALGGLAGWFLSKRYAK